MLKKLFYYILVLIFHFNYSQNKFNSPIDYGILLSGNFGEIRSSGFHTGIDIKTKGKEGEIIRSIDDGYISRIQVSTTGYGKVIYINHYNGLKSVYGHLENFSKNIENEVKYYQYKNKSYIVNLYFKENEINVKKGEVIGFSGNTGTSFGPHLHFEIRTLNDIPLNPLGYKYNIADTIRPVARRLYVYKKNHGSLYKKRLQIKRHNDSVYKTELKSNDTIFFGIETTDNQSYTYNINGTYRILLQEEEKDLIEFKFDSLTFNEKKMFLKHLDFEELIRNNAKIILLNDEIDSNYKFVKENKSGKFYIKNSEIRNFTIKLSDFNNNNTYVKIKVFGDSIKKFQGSKNIQYEKEIKSNLSYNLTYNNANVKFMKNTFYKDVTIHFDFNNDTLFITNPYIPVNKSFIINFPVKNKFTKGAYLARADKNDNIYYSSSKIINNYIVSNSKSLGKYFISIDTVSPKIKKIGKDNSLSKKQKLRYYIHDNETGIKKYQAFINDQWALFEYEPKKNYIQYTPDNFVKLEKVNNLLIILEDMVGNKKEFSEIFYYKN